MATQTQVPNKAAVTRTVGEWDYIAESIYGIDQFQRLYNKICQKLPGLDHAYDDDKLTIIVKITDWRSLVEQGLDN